MTETCVSVSHFRVHLKEIANAVARGEERLLVARHELEMFAIVSREDLEFLRKHRPATDAPVMSEKKLRLVHPDEMPGEMVDELYRATTGATDLAIVAWRGKAYVNIRARTGKYPDKPPY